MDRGERARDEVWSIKNEEKIYEDVLRSQVLLDIQPSKEELQVEEAENAAFLSPADFMARLQKSPANIDSRALHIGKKVSDGSFGDVFLGTLNKADVVIKSMRSLSEPRAQDSFLREVEAMMELSHPYLVKVIGVHVAAQVSLVTECYPHGPVNLYLQRHRSMSQGALVKFASQISCALQFLETKKFVCRDLCARNILVSTPECCKISDFGLSKALDLGGDYFRSAANGKWPLKWYAPECVLQSVFTSQSDVWAFGVTLWELFSYGEQPYVGLRGKEVIEMVERGDRLLPPAKCPGWAVEVMRGCWQRDPRKRLTAKEIYQTCLQHL